METGNRAIGKYRKSFYRKKKIGKYRKSFFYRKIKEKPKGFETGEGAGDGQGTGGVEQATPPRGSRDAQDQPHKGMGKDEAVRQEKLLEWEPQHREGAPEEADCLEG